MYILHTWHRHMSRTDDHTRPLLRSEICHQSLPISPWRSGRATVLQCSGYINQKIAAHSITRPAHTKVSKHIDTQLVDNLRHLICFKWRHFTQLIPLLSRTAQTVSCCYLLPHIIHTLVVAATYCLLSDTTCTWSYRAAALQTIHLMWEQLKTCSQR